MATIRKVFSVMIYKEMKDVYDIEGKEHQGYNDIPKTWWLYNSEQLMDGLTPPLDSDHWIPYHSSMERHVWDFRVTQKTTTKEKWGETQYRNSTHVEMICNGRTFYSFGTSGGDRGISFAFAKIQYMMVHLSEHPFNFFDPMTENGRKICWYGLPATIRVSEHDSWEIRIIPDYTAGLTEDQWWEELARREHKHTLPTPDDDHIDEMYRSEDRQSGYINWGDAFSDGHIYWFRK